MAVLLRAAESWVFLVFIQALAALCGGSSNWAQQPRGQLRRVEPRGMLNPGNLCFMNSTFQVTPGMLNWAEWGGLWAGVVACGTPAVSVLVAPPLSPLLA